ncbi:MAG: SH3 domain-containing protein [Paracoccus sp. (in: a-proteobacteria)]|nr:SH3 domain-containing protein [Paracoccus sp. (in: a-proteobacteria)]
MFKLIFLTLGALFLVLTVYGDGEGRQASASRAQTGTTAAPASDAVSLQNLLPSDKPELIVEVQQTPEQVQPFPGPALQSSPEYAGAEPAAPEQEQTEDSLFVSGNSVNFRAGPTTNDRVIGALRRGAMVTAIGATGGEWVQIRDAEGREGYMAARFLQATRP